jgi:drug/metabolite transporter (DMT)-like permease
VLLGEAFTPRSGIATVVIVAGVALIVTKPRTARPAPEAMPEAVVAEAVDSCS